MPQIYRNIFLISMFRTMQYMWKRIKINKKSSWTIGLTCCILFKKNPAWWFRKTIENYSYFDGLTPGLDNYEFNVIFIMWSNAVYSRMNTTYSCSYNVISRIFFSDCGIAFLPHCANYSVCTLLCTPLSKILTT